MCFATGGPSKLDSGLLQLEEKSLVHKKKIIQKIILAIFLVTHYFPGIEMGVLYVNF